MIESSSDVLCLHVFVKERAFVEAEVAPAGQQEASEDKRSHADENTRSEKVGSQDVEIPGAARELERQLDKAFDRVYQVDQEIEDKPVKNQGMEEADPWTFR